VRTLARIGMTGVLVTLALASTLLVGSGRLHDGAAGSTGAAAPSSSPASAPSGPPVLVPTDDPTAPTDPDSDPPAPPRTVTVLMSGDLLWHNTVWQSAHEDAVRRGLPQRFDFDTMFAAMKPLVESADLAICHEEVPFAGDDEHLSSYPVFAAPPEIARWIASMGWDACTTDSNHSIDQGVDGLIRTANLLERAGVRHVGTFRSPAERRKPVILTTAEGVKVGIVGGTYSLNGLTLPRGRRWAVSMWDADNLIRQARAARRAGADIVLVQYHGGDEYSALPKAQQVALVRRLTASPYVDLVFAEHAHVVQPVTQVNGKWVVYGMGNMVAQSDTDYPRAYEGITVRFRFTERHGRFVVTRAAYLPTVWNHVSGPAPIRIRRVGGTLGPGAPDRARLLEARRMTAQAVAGLEPRRDTVPGLHQR
jgi:poly-gamma-glutamate capsule biosynthesis protein CapA/YwtB (metallophosphatase superfamily)